MLLKMPREGEPHWWIRPFTFNKTHKRTDPKPVKICMAPFISTHKLKLAQGLNHSSCNRLFRYGLMPHILKCNAFPELAGDRDLSDGTELRGKQDHKCNLLKMLCGFLHFCRDEESNGLCLCKHCSLSLLEKATSVPFAPAAKQVPGKSLSLPLSLSFHSLGMFPATWKSIWQLSLTPVRCWTDESF